MKNLDSDRVLGAGILVGVILAAIAYFGFIYLGYKMEVLLVVVSVAFLAVLGIGGWIGWTMVTTPTPEEIEDIEDMDMEDDFEETEVEPKPENEEE